MTTLSMVAYVAGVLLGYVTTVYARQPARSDGRRP